MRAGPILRTPARRRRQWLASLVLSLLLAGCSGLGPRTIPVDQVDYADAVSDAAKRQVLLNVVKLHFGDFPAFVTVSQLVAGYQLSGSVALGAGVSNFGLTHQPFSNTGTLSLDGTFSDNPTVTYSPLVGSDFIDTLLAPLPPNDVFALIPVGIPLRMIFGVGLHSFGPYHNELGSPLGSVRADPEFIEVVDLIAELSSTRRVTLTLRPPKDEKPSQKPAEKADGKGPKREIFLLFLDGPAEPRLLAAEARFRELLHLDAARKEFRLVFGLAPSEAEEISVRTRSLIEILGDLASSVEAAEPTSVPSADGNAAAPSAVRLFAPDVRVRRSLIPPIGAFTSIRYRDHWFFIADDDARSKQLFTLVMLLFSLAESTKPLQLPVLTIPAG